MCSATKGLSAASLPMAFSNISPDAPYWRTMFTEEPWAIRPSYTRLAGFETQLIKPDLLHIWHLGCGRDLAGSVIMYIVKHKADCPGILLGTNIKDRLADATSKLKAYAKSRKLPLKLHKLSKSKLGLKTKTSYPELRSSGYDTYVVLEWLNDLCSRHNSVLPRDICTCFWCATHLMSMLHNAGQHLSPVEEQNKLQFGRLYLHCYVSLARSCLQNIRRMEYLFRLRPKFHILAHIFCESVPSRSNIAQFSTWIDEDSLKKLMRVLRMSDKRTAEKRLLQRYILDLAGTWNRKLRKS